MQQHPLVASPAISRHATRGNNQISRGNPDTGAGDQKKKICWLLCMHSNRLIIFLLAERALCTFCMQEDDPKMVITGRVT
jgi:hypothetical protein